MEISILRAFSTGPSGLPLLNWGAVINYATGLRVRNPAVRVSSCKGYVLVLFLPAPLKAGECPQGSPTSSRAHIGPRMAGGGHGAARFRDAIGSGYPVERLHGAPGLLVASRAAFLLLLFLLPLLVLLFFSSPATARQCGSRHEKGGQQRYQFLASQGPSSVYCSFARPHRSLPIVVTSNERGAPVLMVYPSSTGARRFLFSYPERCGSLIV